MGSIVGDDGFQGAGRDGFRRASWAPPAQRLPEQAADEPYLAVFSGLAGGWANTSASRAASQAGGQVGGQPRAVNPPPPVAPPGEPPQWRDRVVEGTPSGQVDPTRPGWQSASTGPRAVAPGSVSGAGAGYSGAGYPAAGYQAGGSPGSDYPSNATPNGTSSNGGYPGSGYAGNGYPGSGIPSSGYPSNAYPGNGYPGSDYLGADPLDVAPRVARPTTSPVDPASPGDRGPAVAPPAPGSLELARSLVDTGPFEAAAFRAAPAPGFTRPSGFTQVPAATLAPAASQAPAAAGTYDPAAFDTGSFATIGPLGNTGAFDTGSFATVGPLGSSGSPPAGPPATTAPLAAAPIMEAPVVEAPVVEAPVADRGRPPIEAVAEPVAASTELAPVTAIEPLGPDVSGAHPVIDATGSLPVPISPPTGPLDVAPLADLGGYGYSPVRRSAPGPTFQPSIRRRQGRTPRRTGRSVVSVDNNKCHLYAICQMEAPASFLVAQDGRLYYDAAPPAEQMPSVRQAARFCPMQAIALRIEP